MGFLERKVMSMFSLDNVPFSASSSWNTPIPATATFAPVNWPASTGYNYSVAYESYTPAVYVSSPSDPVVEVTYPENWGYPAGSVSIHMPAAADGAVGGDGELLVIDGDTVYNFYQFERTGLNTGTASAIGIENVVAGDGWGSSNPFLSAGIVAAGSSQLAGLLVEAETRDGSIDHALHLAVDMQLVQPGHTGQAINGDGPNPNGIVQEGQHLAIPPGTPMPAGLSPLGQQVFHAYQQYGAFVVDVAGGVTNVRAQSNAFDLATMDALWQDMGKLTPLLQHVSFSPASTPPGTTTPPNTNTPPVTTTPPDTSTPPVTTPPPSTPPNTNTPPVTTTPPDTGTPPVTSAPRDRTSKPGSDVTTPPERTCGTGSTHRGHKGDVIGAPALPTGRHRTSPQAGDSDWDRLASHSRPHRSASAPDLAGHQNPRSLAEIGFGRQATLGYSAASSDAGALSTAGGGAHNSAIALLGQYAAASFVKAGDGFGRLPVHDQTSANLAHTLTRPHA